MSCDRCRADKADLVHMFWSCSKLREFWTSIFVILNGAFGLALQDSPVTATFRVQGDDTVMPSKNEKVIVFATLIVPRRLLIDSKTSAPPEASMWLSDMMMFLKIEKIKFFLRGATK